MLTAGRYKCGQEAHIKAATAMSALTFGPGGDLDLRFGSLALVGVDGEEKHPPVWHPADVEAMRYAFNSLPDPLKKDAKPKHIVEVFRINANGVYKTEGGKYNVSDGYTDPFLSAQATYAKNIWKRAQAKQGASDQAGASGAGAEGAQPSAARVHAARAPASRAPPTETLPKNKAVAKLALIALGVEEPTEQQLVVLANMIDAAVAMATVNAT